MYMYKAIPSPLLHVGGIPGPNPGLTVGGCRGRDEHGRSSKEEHCLCGDTPSLSQGESQVAAAQGMNTIVP